MEDRICIVGGVRSPFAKAFTGLAELTAFDLALTITNELLQRSELPPDAVDEMIWASVLPTMERLNIGREVPLTLGMDRIPGYTLGQQCASGIQAITSAPEHIRSGQVQVIVAGGAESMSNTAVTFRRRLIRGLVNFRQARGLGRRLRALLGIHPGDFVPRMPAIEEPSTGLSMGEHTELMAQLNGISREDQDVYALDSHRKAAAARESGRIEGDLVPIALGDHFFVEDNLIRADTSLEKLAQLPPVFDRRHGTLTAGNSSALTDGASAVMVMSATRANDLGIEPLGFIRAYDYVAIPPHPQLLLGPAYTVPRLLNRTGFALQDMDLVEIHEAFAAQVLSVLQKLESDDFAREELGHSKAVGAVDRDILNVNGGSLAFGHPFAATGGRIVINLLQELRRRDKERGILTICTANAMGVSMILERN
jgi:acetyl-CoA acyltransferase